MIKKTSLLVIEDDQTILKHLIPLLEEEGFNVNSADNAIDGFFEISKEKYDLILLDLNLPDINGFEVLKKVKQEYGTPVIIISAFNDIDNILKSFNLGANDFMSKPVNFRELVARIWNIIKNHINQDSKTKKHKSHFKIDKKNKTISAKEKIIDLTLIEYTILEHLINAKQNFVKRDDLFALISQTKTSRVLDYHIKNIRYKIADDTNKNKYIKTIYGQGFRLINPPI